MWKIRATEVGEAEREQPDEPREGMISRFSDLHGGLGLPNGLVEPTEFGEHIGEAAPGER